MRKFFWVMLIGHLVAGSLYYNGGIIPESAGKAIYNAICAGVFALLLIHDQLRSGEKKT